MSDTSYNIFQHYGTHAARLAFTPTPGSGQPIYIWYETDTGSAFLYDTSWHQITTSATGSVTNTGTLTNHALIKGNGGVDVSALGSLGTTTTVLHGNAAGDPTFGAVSLTADVTGTLPKANQGAGTIVQVVNTETGAVATGTTTIPFDDTIPQNTEGTEFMTLAITPTSATNKLRIEVSAYVGISASKLVSIALFQDSTANALASAWADFINGSGINALNFSWYMTAGTTSSTTFKIRIGPDSAATVTFNGSGGGRIYGGSLASSITITEIQV